MIMLHLVLLPCIYIQPIRPLCSPLLIHYSYVQYWNQLLHEGKTKLDPFFFFFFFYYSSPCYAVQTKNIVEYSYFRKDVKAIAKPFLHLSEKTVPTCIQKQWYLSFFFFLLKSKGKIKGLRFSLNYCTWDVFFDKYLFCFLFLFLNVFISTMIYFSFLS